MKIYFGILGIFASQIIFAPDSQDSVTDTQNSFADSATIIQDLLRKAKHDDTAYQKKIQESLAATLTSQKEERDSLAALPSPSDVEKARLDRLKRLIGAGEKQLQKKQANQKNLPTVETKTNKGSGSGWQKVRQNLGKLVPRQVRTMPSRRT